jgi:hypothetical protein
MHVHHNRLLDERWSHLGSVPDSTALLTWAEVQLSHALYDQDVATEGAVI